MGCIRDRLPEGWWPTNRDKRWWIFFILGSICTVSIIIGVSFFIARYYGPKPSPRILNPNAKRNTIPIGSDSDTFTAPFETSMGPNGAFMVAAQVGSGIPTLIDVLLDTGSSDIWLDSTTGYPQASSSFIKNTSATYTAHYMGGAVTGSIAVDYITLDSYTWKQQFGAVETVNMGLEGIIGLSRGGCDERNVCVFTNWKLAQAIFSFYYDRLTWSGWMIAGAVDAAKYCATGSSIVYLPQTGNYFWQIPVNLDFNGVSIGTGLNAVVDTGTTYMMLSKSLYDKAMSIVLSGQGCTHPTMTIFVNGAPFVIPSIVLVMDNVNGCKLRLESFDKDRFPFDMIIGATFLINFYSVFDMVNNQVGFCPPKPGLTVRGSARRLEDTELLGNLLDRPERRHRWK